MYEGGDVIKKFEQRVHVQVSLSLISDSCFSLTLGILKLFKVQDALPFPQKTVKNVQMENNK